MPSFKNTQDWQKYGATVATKDTVGKCIAHLCQGNYENTVVLANRYDGIDLPDESCRILLCDGKPYSESLIDLYHEACRPNSEATLMRAVRTVEQGLGRSVRGEKDYSVVVIIGPDLTRLLRDKHSRKFLSNQMATQVEIGLEIAEMARQDIEGGETPVKAFLGLIRKCLLRDPDWKAFYAEQMEAVKPAGANMQLLKQYAAELAAEQKYRTDDYESAASMVQKLLHRARCK